MKLILCLFVFLFLFSVSSQDFAFFVMLNVVGVVYYVVFLSVGAACYLFLVCVGIVYDFITFCCSCMLLPCFIFKSFFS